MIDPVLGITGIERNFFQDIGQSYQSLATRRVSLSKFLDLRGHMWSFPLGLGADGDGGGVGRSSLKERLNSF